MGKVALVIGGAGFIGSHLLQRLAADKSYSEIVSVDITSPRIVVENVRYMIWDITDPLPIDICPGVTEIYNLAAVHTTPGHEDWEYYWTNVLGAIHVCDYARQMDVGTILFTSSIAVYGPTEAPVDEDTPPDPESAYGKSKLCAEKIHQLWFGEDPDARRLLIVRPAVIYGPQERGNFTRLARLLSKGRFFYPGRKDTIKSCGYVKNLIDSFAHMMVQPERELIYNFAYPERHTTEHICSAFHHVARYSCPTIVFPLTIMLFAARCFELLALFGLKTSINRARIRKLNRSTNILPTRLIQCGFAHRFGLADSLRDWQSSNPSGFFD